MNKRTIFFYLKILTILFTGWFLKYNEAIVYDVFPFLEDSNESNHSIEDKSLIDQLLTQQLNEEDLAYQVAQSLNDHWSMEEINQFFLQEMNEQRYLQGFVPIEIDYSLKEGAQSYNQALIDYHYLSSTAPDGSDFRTFFPQIDDAPYRLSSYLYELYIPTRDIHLSTWQQHPEVLANFLMKQWQDNIHPEVMGQYLSLKAQAEWNEQHSEYYIRIVGVLITDTSTVQYD